MNLNETLDAQLIKVYRDLRTVVAEKEEALNAELKAYKEAMAAIEGECQKRLNERGVNSISCDDGTMYRSTLTSVRTADKGSFIDWVVAQDNLREMDVRPAKDYVKTWMDEHGAPPPGVDVTLVHKVNFRK